MKRLFGDNASKKKRRLCIVIASCVAALAVLITVIISSTTSEPLSETRFLLDTVCTVTIYDRNHRSESILDGAFDLCASYDKLFSVTDTGSDVYRINHSGGKQVTVSDATAALLKRALEFCRLSGGEFDITVYPAKRLWDFSGEDACVPDAEALASAASMIDYRKVKVNGNAVTLSDGMGIDLGAIAKGFIADQMADYLRKHHIQSAIIDLGGNIYALGSKPDGGEWRVGVRMPFADGEAAVIEAADESVVTSGVYQRYFKIGGTIYHHILRPSDGMPCETGLNSVTVIAKSSEMCDALSTVCMLLGYEKSISFLKQFDGIRAVFIDSDNTVQFYP